MSWLKNAVATFGKPVSLHRVASTKPKSESSKEDKASRRVKRAETVREDGGGKLELRAASKLAREAAKRAVAAERRQAEKTRIALETLSIPGQHSQTKRSWATAALRRVAMESLVHDE